MAEPSLSHHSPPRLSFGRIAHQHIQALISQLDTIAVTNAFPNDAAFTGQGTSVRVPSTPRQRLHFLRECGFSKLSYPASGRSFEFKFTSSRYIVTTKEGKDYVLLYPHPKYGGLLLSTGGHVELGESIEEAGIRERKEELAIATMKMGKTLRIPNSFFDPCPLTGRRYHDAQSIFEIGELIDPETRLPLRLDVRSVELQDPADVDIRRSYPAVHEHTDKPSPPDFRFYELDKLCQEGHKKPNPAFLAADPTYYQRFDCLKHFLTLARKAGKI